MFSDIMYSDKNDSSRAVKEYIIVTDQHKDINEIIKLNTKDFRCLNTIKLFLILSLKIKINDFNDLKVTKPKNVINFFNLVDEDFWQFLKHFNKSSQLENTFLITVIKIIIELGLTNIKELTYKNIVTDCIILNKNNGDNLLKELVAFYKIKYLNIPSLEKYINFFRYFSEEKEYESTARKRYISAVSSVKDLEDLLSSERIQSNIKMFIMLNLNAPIDQKITIPISYPEKYINYFGLADEKFWDVFHCYVKGSVRRKQKFLAAILRVLLNLGKRKVADLNYDDLKLLYTEQYYYGALETENFIPIIEKIIINYTNEARPTVARKFSYVGVSALDRYGTCNSEFIKLIDKYLEIRYIQKGYNIKFPISHIKTFFSWLSENNPELLFIGEINDEILDEYKYHILNLDYKSRTIAAKFDIINQFFRWLFEEKRIDRVINITVKLNKTDQSKSRMFEGREHFKKVLYEIMNFEPQDEKQYLIKHFLIVASATGLRFSEVRWLGPDCIKSISEDIGEITLQIKEKQRKQNKTTSILPWGISSINELNERFHKKKNKIRFYHENTKDYFYVLFEYEDRMLAASEILLTLRTLFNKADLRDDQGNLVDYSNIKTHAFRHQKFSDIFDVTNGSLTSVKLDSGHKTIEMSKKYIRQSSRKKQIEMIKLVEEGKIVGKSAQILIDLLNVKIEPLKYIDLVKKMNLTELKASLSKSIRSLGFGLCFAKKCKLAPICEGCDYYLVSDNEIEVLKHKYSSNYQILKYKIFETGEADFLNSEDSLNLIEEIKYQEKWLKELGETDAEIEKLRKEFYEVNQDGN
jgi:site-specific recombinase XerD